VAHDAHAVRAPQRHLDIVCDLGLGDGTFTVLTKDLTHEYIEDPIR
jgi:N-acetylglutamate synthase/N-acetylornithine aminotransferase